MELIKGSLNTFLNAMTYPDRTCYPVASCNLQNFRNLVDVYLDAVFHPRCVNNEKTFQQEGWHYELDSPDQEMTFKGVVYNEMKGVYSSPDSVLAREAQQALFPDNTYGVDSGGDPTVIPSSRSRSSGTSTASSTTPPTPDVVLRRRRRGGATQDPRLVPVRV